jgi:oligopeptide transport system permease protein
MSEKTTAGPGTSPPDTVMGPGTVAGDNAGAVLSEETPLRVGSLWSDAWHDLRRNPFFVVSGLVILLLLVVAVAPSLFTARSPFEPGFCQLADSLKTPSAGHWFGFDIQGCDVYTRTIWGARNSIIVGLITTTMTAVVGGMLGMIAGYEGGAVDSVLARVTDVFFALPLILGGLLVLSIFATGNVYTVALVLAVLGWPTLFRIMRSSVISTKNADYVVAARGLGAGTPRVLRSHVLPNALVPVIVVSTLNLGVYIAAEAALSYLGIGVQPPNISWGLMISDASARFLQAPHMLLFPALFLSITVLSFIMLGDAVRDALDPKLR